MQVELTKDEAARAEDVYNTCGGMVGKEKISQELAKMGEWVGSGELTELLKRVGYDTGGCSCLQARQWIDILKVLKGHYTAKALQPECDSVEAFSSLSGGVGKHGYITLAKLQEVVSDFQLRVDTSLLLTSLDEGELDGKLSFAEFVKLLAVDAPPASSPTYTYSSPPPPPPPRPKPAPEAQPPPPAANVPPTPAHHAPKHYRKYGNDYVSPGPGVKKIKLCHRLPAGEVVQERTKGSVFERLTSVHDYHPAEVVKALQKCLKRLEGGMGDSGGSGRGGGKAASSPVMSLELGVSLASCRSSTVFEKKKPKKTPKIASRDVPKKTTLRPLSAKPCGDVRTWYKVVTGGVKKRPLSAPLRGGSLVKSLRKQKQDAAAESTWELAELPSPTATHELLRNVASKHQRLSTPVCYKDLVGINFKKLHASA